MERISAAEPIPPLIALGTDRLLVDGYARLGISHASVLLQVT